MYVPNETYQQVKTLLAPSDEYPFEEETKVNFKGYYMTVVEIRHKWKSDNLKKQWEKTIEL